MAEEQLFEGSILKIDANGNQVLSSYLGMGERRAYDDVRARTNELDFAVVQEPHAAPYNFVAVPDGNGGLMLSWDPPNDFGDFPDAYIMEYQIRTDPDMYVFAPPGEATSFNAVAGDLTQGDTMRLRIRAYVDQDGSNAVYTDWSEWTEEVTAA